MPWTRMHERSISMFRVLGSAAEQQLDVPISRQSEFTGGMHLKLLKLKVVENRNRRAILLSLVCMPLLAASALLITACDSREQRVAEASTTALPVDAVRVRQENVPLVGDWVGTLDGFVNAQIQPQVSGYLVQQKYREGSLVAKDQVLFQIDRRQFQATVDQAAAQVEQAKGQ